MYKELDDVFENLEEKLIKQGLIGQYGFNKVVENIESLELPNEPAELESNVSRKF
jgi:hypothetical protein